MLGAMQWGMNVHGKSQSKININRNRKDKSRSAERCGFGF